MQLGQMPRGGIHTIGDVSLLRRSLGFFCSAKCPGTVIVKSCAAARKMRGTQYAVVSGFHSPVEKDCLEILLSGNGAIVVCPARQLNPRRLPHEWKAAIDAGRMLLVSPFDAKQQRTTAELAIKRNQFVASIADEILIVYGHPGSKTEALSREVLASGKRVYTFNDPANANLISMGAVPIKPDHFSKLQHVNT